MALAALALMLRRPWSVPLAILATLHGAGRLRRTLPDVPESQHAATRLSARGLGWSLRQESALVLRHWWPPALLAALLSRNARRVVVSALIIDVVAARIENPDVAPVLAFAGRRCDDLAYGAGLWWGALRARSLRCLRIRVTGVRHSPPRPG